MSKHTPGPWNIKSFGSAEIIISAPTMPYVAVASPSLHAQTGTGESNARLIAAAPELLEACKFALDHLDPSNGAEECREQVKKAIAKAEGTNE